MEKRDSDVEPALSDVGVLVSIGIGEKKRKVHDYDVGVLPECLTYVETRKSVISAKMNRCQEAIDYWNTRVDDFHRQWDGLGKAMQFQVTMSKLLKDLIIPNSQVKVSKLGIGVSSAENMVGTGEGKDAIDDESPSEEVGTE